MYLSIYNVLDDWCINAYSLNVFVTLFPAKNKEKEAKDVKKSAVAVLREVLYDQSQVGQKKVYL